MEEEIAQLHGRCGVYTRKEIVGSVLDQVGWRADVDLRSQRLLEPAAGDGAFVIEAARRLVRSCRRFRCALTAMMLRNRIKAYELYRPEAERARHSVEATLREEGLHWKTARALARKWVIEGDFLLSGSSPGGFTHVVGNPPYVRWSKLPKGLKTQYERHLAKEMVGGDLFLPFLDRALAQLDEGGRLGVVCSDRWRYMAFAEGFRNKWLPRLDIQSNTSLVAADAFVESVDAYATALIARKRAYAAAAPRRTAARNVRTLAEAGYIVRVGPALGCTPAFVLQADEHDVEAELLHPWLDGSEIGDGTIESRGRRLIAMFGEDGSLVSARRFPKLLKRLKAHKASLETRSIVKHGAPWYRTIDRFKPTDWHRPKLLVPELAKVPRIALDLSGAIPSHGVYAIFAPLGELEFLYARLSSGGLATALEGIAPKVKGGYVRCYRRFLEKVRI